MSDITEQEVIRRLECLGALEPSPVVVEHALERTRRALAASPVAKLPSRRRIVLRRLAVAAAVLLVAGGLFAWLFPLPSSAEASFAEVQAAIKSSGSLTCRQSTTVKGEVKETITIRILASGVFRVEESDGNYVITDPVHHKALMVEPGKKEAVLKQGLNLPLINLYELLKKLPSDAAAKPLPGKKLDGKAVLGFKVPAPCENTCLKGKEVMLTVWADPGTRLPVRIEAGGTDEKGDAVELVVDQMVFDKSLDEKLFALEPPPGYSLRTEGLANLPGAPADPKMKDPVVTPRKGVGPVEFGMTREQVEKALGKADEAKEVGKNGLVVLDYGSRGLSISVSKTRGVLMITCSAQPVTIQRIRDFSGKTDKGIALGARAADVIEAYGEPTETTKDEGTTHLIYRKLNAWFTFFDDKLVQIHLNFPR